VFSWDRQLKAYFTRISPLPDELQTG